MIGRRHLVPSNETTQVIPVFTPDPHGAAMFGGILAGNGLGLQTELRPVIDARGGGRFTGPLNGLQNYRGAGNIGNTGSAVVPASTRLDQTAGSAVSTPVQQIFTQRAAARRFS